MSKETRLQNGGKICRDWSGPVMIWQIRCQSSQSIINFLSHFFKPTPDGILSTIYLLLVKSPRGVPVAEEGVVVRLTAFRFDP